MAGNKAIMVSCLGFGVLVAIVQCLQTGVQAAPKRHPSDFLRDRGDLSRRDDFDVNDYRILTDGSGNARVSEEGENLPSVKVPRKEKFPLGSIRELPTNGVQLKKVQSSNGKGADDEKRNAVKDAFKISWQQYVDHAWGKDEVKPVSNQSQNPFTGWAATMVDTLDTLKIMGLDDEFDKAVNYIKDIDFTSTFREDIPLFETVIRYLGGLISAYDLSQEKVLLDQATVLADNLMGVFDTPNRMPLLFYKWQDKDTKYKYLAGTDSSVAGTGSLTVEFMRLAQLTKDAKYYDAVDRITDHFNEVIKPKSPIPGLLPGNVDSSGCNVVYTDSDNANKDDTVTLNKRDDMEPALVPSGTDGEYVRAHCRPQEMDLAANKDVSFQFGAGIDSTYEYFMKTYQLLKGADDKYKKLYEDLLEPAKKYILYKPKVQNNDKILFLGSQSVNSDGSFSAGYGMQHLTCFAGGMFALGGKLLGRSEDLDIAERVTQGCVWAYNATKTGVMPESLNVDPCDNREDWDAECNFDGSSSPDMPSGIKSMSEKYYLRPEAIESVFYMWRVTGDVKWRDQGWDMVKSILKLTAIKDSSGQTVGYSGVKDVNDDSGNKDNLADVAESFWMAETLKYSYLLFDDFDRISLDDYVFNTEAHPFKVD